MDRFISTDLNSFIDTINVKILMSKHIDDGTETMRNVPSFKQVTFPRADINDETFQVKCQLSFCLQ